jgi:fructose-1,6-bisphosphatase
MENHLIDPKDYKNNIVKGVKQSYRRQQKTIHWSAKIERIKIFIESKGHKFIKYDQNLWYFEGLPLMNARQLRLYYDRQVYKERKSKIENWSQSSKTQSI